MKTQIRKFRYRKPIFYSTIISFSLATITFFANYLGKEDKNFVLLFTIFVLTFGITFCISTLIKLVETTSPLGETLENITNKFEKDIASFKIQTYVNDLSNYINEKKDKTIVYDTLSTTFQRHFYKLNILDKSVFIIKGEKQAMEAYLTFWKKMLKEQIKRNEVNNRKKNKPLIARITHSNNVKIWQENENPFAEDLLKIQKRFVESGGRLIRFFITNSDNIDETKKQKIKAIVDNHRKKYKLATWHVITYSDELPYDFIYLHEEKIILKWFTTTSGQRLAWMEIVDEIPEGDLTHSTWSKIWYKCLDMNYEEKENIKKQLNKIIPEKWQYDYKTL
ncbi:hypothetical protein [Kordia sp.]|uniref:hypothetical protein n=1 Tax=Kordia sp. TaxID=1965332 RepID=UPI003D2C05E6